MLKMLHLPVQVDLAMDPLRREEMVAGSDGSRMLPQLHVNGKFVGDCDDIQELEDFGELSAVLNPEFEAAAAVPELAKPETDS